MEQTSFSLTLLIGSSKVIVTGMSKSYFKEACPVSYLRRTEPSGVSATDPVLENRSD